MNAPRDRIPETGSETYLFASSNGSHITWLTDALGALGSVVVLAPDTKSIDERIFCEVSCRDAEVLPRT